MLRPTTTLYTTSSVGRANGSFLHCPTSQEETAGAVTLQSVNTLTAVNPAPTPLTPSQHSAIHILPQASEAKPLKRQFSIRWACCESSARSPIKGL